MLVTTMDYMPTNYACLKGEKRTKLGFTLNLEQKAPNAESEARNRTTTTTKYDRSFLPRQHLDELKAGGFHLVVSKMFNSSSRSSGLGLLAMHTFPPLAVPSLFLPAIDLTSR